MVDYTTWTIEALEARLEALSAQRAALEDEWRRVQEALAIKRAELAVRLRLEQLSDAERRALVRLVAPIAASMAKPSESSVVTEP